jgi:hypothetical protein
MNEGGVAHVRESPARRLSDVTDRILPLGWLALYVLLPLSGNASEAFAGWQDQGFYLEALRSVLRDGRADLLDENAIGPAYIAGAALIHFVGGLTPEDSLVTLNRASYALSVGGGMVVVRIFVRRLASVPAAVSLAAQLVFLALVIGSWTWTWSDLPWSHFFAMFLAIGLYTVRVAPERGSVVSAAAIGIALALLALTRSFEFAALIIAWGLALAVFAALRMRWVSGLRALHVFVGAGAFVVAVSGVHLFTGKRGVFFLYGSNLGRQSADVAPAEIAETPTFSPALVPVKLVQLFVDPCFYSDCAVNDYSGGTTSLEGLWRMPLAIQQPGLVLLPPCLVAVSALVVWSSRNRDIFVSRARELRLLLEMTLAAVGITLGYVASTLTSSSHLKYGFAREFLLPAALASVVGVSIAVTGFWLAFRRSHQHESRLARPRVSQLGIGIFLTVLCVATLLLGTAAARTYGLPRLESRHLGQIEYVADCRGQACSIAISALTSAGRSLSIPQASTLTFGCGGRTARFSLHVRNPSTGVRFTQACQDARLVAAWPLVMGLPPTQEELAAIVVRNV